VRTVAALLGRKTGLEMLRRMFGRPDVYSVRAVWTHPRLPLTESPERAMRPEFPEFERLCCEHRVPLHTVETRAEADALAAGLSRYRFDYLTSLSWRFAVRPDALGLARVACVNLHRGKLPEYPGAEPVRRMLEAGERYAVISAHEMAETVDSGPVLVAPKFPMRILPGETSAAAAERVKRELTPHYFDVLEQALAVVEARKGVR
jgi:methionyl-tRNA formyltransferase